MIADSIIRCAACNMVALQKKGIVANKTLLKQEFSGRQVYCDPKDLQS